MKAPRQQRWTSVMGELVAKQQRLTSSPGLPSQCALFSSRLSTSVCTMQLQYKSTFSNLLITVKALNFAWDLFCEFRGQTVSTKLNTT